MRKGHLSVRKSIFRYLLIPMCVLVLVEVVILSGSFSFGGLYDRIDQNARDSVNQKTMYRSSNLLNQMLQHWSDVDGAAAVVNEAAKRLVDEKKVTYKDLENNEEAASMLLNEITDDLIGMIRANQVTGAYVILNSSDLEKEKGEKQGIYLRDLDPTSKSATADGDILVERAPANVVKEHELATDSYWQSSFDLKEQTDDDLDFIYMPFQTAYAHSSDYTSKEMGYWSKTTDLNHNDQAVLTYSQPLINEQGKVYGVIGIDLTTEYLEKLLPGEELMDGDYGSYLLAIGDSDGKEFENVFVNGSEYEPQTNQTTIHKKNHITTIKNGDESLYASVQYVNIYDSNTPYSNQKWALIGIVKNTNLYEFSSQILAIISIAIVAMLIVGVFGSGIVSYIITKPVRKLAGEVEDSDSDDFVGFNKTNIAEIDHLAETMEELMTNIRETSMKFSNILKISSIKMAGFEYNEKLNQLFISDNFFEVFLDTSVAPQKQTYQMKASFLREKFLEYRKYITARNYTKDEYLFKIPDGDSYAYVNLHLVRGEGTITGVAEDVTRTIIERQVIEYERDHDALTGLLNRRAFLRNVGDLFKNQKVTLKIAGLLMLDLDNLKYINDTFGHEYGDRYIIKMAGILQNVAPKEAIISRISGDEFYMFLYGYETEEAIRSYVSALKKNLAKESIYLPDCNKFKVTASGGISWYPKDTNLFEQMQHYADYAMYKMKKTCKGEISEFNKQEYMKDSSISEGKKELNRLLNDQSLQYYFQPIVDAHTGEIFAYESLMRSFMPTLKQPLQILEVAKEEGRLLDIEILTWELSIGTYVQHLKEGNIKPGKKLFINSIANQILPSETIHSLEEKYDPYLDKIVLEVVESEKVNQELQNVKQECIRKWNGGIALDDYGTGYNSDLILLKIVPDYIKIDMEIIRNIDKDKDKCGIVTAITTYAHTRHMKVIAEGIETISEMMKVVELGVDYLQGYLLARPSAIPYEIPEHIVKILKERNSDLHQELKK